MSSLPELRAAMEHADELANDLYDWARDTKDRVNGLYDEIADLPCTADRDTHELIYHLVKVHGVKANPDFHSHMWRLQEIHDGARSLA